MMIMFLRLLMCSTRKITSTFEAEYLWIYMQTKCFALSTDFWIKNQFHATYLGAGAPIADRFLGVSMSRAWASFAATGDPNNAIGEPGNSICLN
jgi:hypothetical protein